jgi:uncharacterized protein (TIGR01777 family)
MKKVVIIGATGLIGRHLVKLLDKHGYNLVVVSRNADAARRKLGEKHSYTSWDGKTAAALAPSLEGAEAVVNLAGENIAGGRWTKARKRKILSSRTESTGAVAEAINACQAKPAALIQASAIGYYGASLDQVFDETCPSGNNFLATVSRLWEKSADNTDESVRLVLLRTGIVLSTEGGALAEMVKPFKFGVGGHIGSGKQWMSWIHLEDETEAIRFLIENKNATGVFNLTAPQPVTMENFAGSIGRALGKKSWMHAPSFAIKMAMGEMGKEMLLSGQNVLPKNLTEAGYTFRFSDVDAALEDLLGKK